MSRRNMKPDGSGYRQYDWGAEYPPEKLLTCVYGETVIITVSKTVVFSSNLDRRAYMNSAHGYLPSGRGQVAAFVRWNLRAVIVTSLFPPWGI